jgi:putative heme degradation protein
VLTCAPEPSSRLLRARWAQLEVSEPELDLETAARRLGVTPIALIESRTHDGFLPLTTEWPALASHLCAFGRVSARTGRAGCMLEIAGTFGAPRLAADQLEFDGPQLILHADPRRWSAAFAFELLTRVRTRRGLAFCGDDGELAWTLELITGSNRAVLDAFVDVFGDRRSERPAPRLRAPDEAAPTACATLEDLARRWATTGRSDALAPLIWRYGLGYERVQRQARAQRAERLDAGVLFELVRQANGRGQALRVAAGRDTATLTGRVSGEPRRAGAGWNVVGPDAALHVRDADLGEVWRVHGQRSTIEVFDGARRPLLSISEWSEPSARDSLAWTSLLLAMSAPPRGGAGA